MVAVFALILGVSRHREKRGAEPWQNPSAVDPTAALSETETKLLSTTDSSEFGVPTTSTPAKYSWLGAEQQPTELPSGEIAMGARSYIPELGRFLQTDPMPGGSANAYAYTFGDPVNSGDPSGELTYGFSSWLKAANNQEAKEVVEREVARETLEREEAERRAREAQEAAEAAAAAAAIPAAAEEPLGGSSGWACEYAAETDQEDPECGGGGGGGGGGGETGGGAPVASAASSEWVCTLGGTVVGAGVGVVTAGVTGILAGGAFTAGCELGSSSNKTYVSGLPNHPSDCFNEWTLSKRTHEYDHRNERCYA